MRRLSKAAMTAIAALASDNRLVISTLRTGPSDDWRADVAPRGGLSRITVPINTFRKMRRDGLVEKQSEHRVTDGGLIHSEYVLTDAGRAALADA